MKNLMNKLLMLTALAAMTFMYSCGDDDEETPAAALPSITVALTVNGTSATSPADVVPGDSVGFSISITAAGGFNTYRVYSSLDGGTASQLAENTRIDLEVEAGTTTVADAGNTKIEAANVGSTITFEFEVVDDEGQTGTTSVDLVVGSPAAKVYSTTKLLSPTGDFTNQNFFSVANGMLYSKAEVNATTEAISPMIDFGYYYGNSELASLASPKGFESTVFATQVEGWGTKNATLLKTTEMTASQFLEVSTHAAIETAFDAGTADANGIINGLVVGQVLAFETADGVKGLIHVATIEPGFESNDFIELDILATLDAE